MSSIRDETPRLKPKDYKLNIRSISRKRLVLSWTTNAMMVVHHCSPFL
jgi:hypothetical protein